MQYFRIFTFDLINVKCNVSDKPFLIIDLTEYTSDPTYCINSSNIYNISSFGYNVRLIFLTGNI